jgi:hypothetical protein
MPLSFKAAALGGQGLQGGLIMTAYTGVET